MSEGRGEWSRGGASLVPRTAHLKVHYISFSLSYTFGGTINPLRH